MEHDHQSDKLKVVDKRRYRMESGGTVIEQPDAKKHHEGRAAADAAAAPAPATAQEQAAQPATAPAAQSAAAPVNHAQPPLDEPRSGFRKEPIKDEGMPFMEFIRQQAYLAMIYLGQQPNPGTGLVQQQPEGVREVVDLLTMIRGRVRGNLTADESYALDDLLRQLKMAYLQLTGAVPMGGPGGMPAPGGRHN